MRCTASLPTGRVGVIRSATACRCSTLAATVARKLPHPLLGSGVRGVAGAALLLLFVGPSSAPAHATAPPPPPATVTTTARVTTTATTTAPVTTTPTAGTPQVLPCSLQVAEPCTGLPPRLGSTACPTPVTSRQRVERVRTSPVAFDTTPPAVFLGTVPRYWRADRPLTFHVRACDDQPGVLFEIAIRPIGNLHAYTAWSGIWTAGSIWPNVGGGWRWSRSATWTWRSHHRGAWWACADALDSGFHEALWCKPLTVR